MAKSLNASGGHISTYLTSQKLLDIPNIITIPVANYQEFIINQKISFIIIDNDIYEEDHEWFKGNTQSLLNFAQKNDIDIYIIKNSIKKISQKYVKFTYIEDKCLRVNQRKFNPIDSIKQFDIAFIKKPQSIWKKELKIIVFDDKRSTQDSLMKIIDIIKKSKLCILKLDNYDTSVCKQINYIASLYHTYIIDENSMFEVDFLLDNPKHLERIILKEQRKVLRDYSMCNINIKNYNYLYYYLQDLFYKNQTKPIYISSITSTIRKNNINNVLEMLRKQENVIIESNIMTHGFRLDISEIKKYKLKYPNLKIKFIYCPDKLSLGDCLNIGVRMSKYKYIAKIDDDDMYSENYLEDSFYCLKYSESDIVGKGSHFVYLENINMIINRENDKKNKYSTIVMGATLFGHKCVFEEINFPSLNKSEDSGFLTKINEHNKKIFQGFPYEYCTVRGEKSKHTWKITYKELMRDSKVIGYGNPLPYIKL